MTDRNKSADKSADIPEGNPNFVRSIIRDDLEKQTHAGRVQTRFPPEPNGYLHIGHAKAICLNFGMAEEFNGHCNLRFDDTNPSKEETEYVDAIKRDIRWLGFDWGEGEYYASDYFGKLYDFAEKLIHDGHAYVDDLTPDEMREYRGTLTRPGKNSPYRERPLAESLDLFRRMKAGEFEDGSRVLRAKIDMSSPNLNMRDPVMYRIMRAHHHRTGDEWCIYPMYDFAHGQSDAIENITHSLCSLEFENHRPLYDWFTEVLEFEDPPRQYEFARLNITFTMMSKRKLRELVEQNVVSGWDDPRMPTLAGMRRRGYPPESIRRFCDLIGVSKTNSMVAFSQLEQVIRDQLNKSADRVMAVLDPLKVVITDYPENQVEELPADNNPEDPDAGKRMVPFTRELYIERNDFREEAPRKYFRLAPGKEVRLKHAYYVTCTNIIRDDAGEIVEIHCTHDPATRGGWSEDGRKVRGTLQWVSCSHALNAEVRLYDTLFTVEAPDRVQNGGHFSEYVNPESLRIVPDAKVEPSLAAAEAGKRYQFLRNGYFVVDPDSSDARPVLNRIVSLKSSWAKIEKAQQK